MLPILGAMALPGDELLQLRAGLGVLDLHGRGLHEVRRGGKDRPTDAAVQVNVNVPAYSDSDLHELAEMLLKIQPQRSALESLREVDGSFDIQGLCRFRFNIFRWDGKLGIVMRLIPIQVL